MTRHLREQDEQQSHVCIDEQLNQWSSGKIAGFHPRQTEVRFLSDSFFTRSVYIRFLQLVRFCGSENRLSVSTGVFHQLLLELLTVERGAGSSGLWLAWVQMFVDYTTRSCASAVSGAAAGDRTVNGATLPGALLAARQRWRTRWRHCQYRVPLE